MTGLIFLILIALLLVARCVWELFFLREPLFQRYRNDGVWTLLSLLTSAVCILLAAEVFPFRWNGNGVVLAAAGLAAYWISFFAKSRLPRLVNSLLRLLMAVGLCCSIYLVYLMRNDFKDEQVFITGMLVLVPGLQALLFLTEILFNAAYSAAGKRITWFVSVELGIVLLFLILGIFSGITPHTNMLTTS